MQMVEFIGQHDPAQIQKLIVVWDGSSTITGTEAATNEAYEEMKKLGLRIMTYAEVETLLDSMGL
jgi:hypothetical protein